MNNFLNIFISLVFLSGGAYFIYSTYKKPAVLFGTNLKGFIGGVGLIILGLMSLLGKMNLLEIIKEIFNA
ncbi:hypothetical protein [Flavobacterium stagni]|uniref:Uncharacterized protein n=1 Tax=Flavobacterium stagni TaxID=2506421 RepID=A0A4Q1KA06_9FLAO|nr:hypothetical protein [Flavobacterium stagni]RXR21471.1 hypothetical protein EQG61_12160 [Flavobacterium stagni]